jgi:hypothetical protein
MDIRWLIGRRTKPTFCVFAVFSVAVMEKCCDARREGEYYFRSGFSAVMRLPVFQWHRLPLTGSRWDIRVADRSSNEADFLCILLYLAWRLWKSVVTLVVMKGNTISGQASLIVRGCRRLSGIDRAVDRKSMGHTSS